MAAFCAGEASFGIASNAAVRTVFAGGLARYAALNRRTKSGTIGPDRSSVISKALAMKEHTAADIVSHGVAVPEVEEEEEDEGKDEEEDEEVEVIEIAVGA